MVDGARLNYLPCIVLAFGRGEGGRGKMTEYVKGERGGRNREGEGALPFIQQEKKAPPLPLPCTVPRTFLFY